MRVPSEATAALTNMPARSPDLRAGELPSTEAMNTPLPIDRPSSEGIY